MAFGRRVGVISRRSGRVYSQLPCPQVLLVDRTLEGEGSSWAGIADKWARREMPCTSSCIILAVSRGRKSLSLPNRSSQSCWQAHYLGSWLHLREVVSAASGLVSAAHSCFSSRWEAKGSLAWSLWVLSQNISWNAQESVEFIYFWGK